MTQRQLTSAYKPRLRHCTLVSGPDEDTLTMIVGTNRYEVDKKFADISFLKLKSFFDGRYSLQQISEELSIPVGDLLVLVSEFRRIGLMADVNNSEPIAREMFMTTLYNSCHMWRSQIGFHRLFGGLRESKYRKEVFVGLLIETFHYVRSASRHIGVAIDHCDNSHWKEILTQYQEDEKDHSPLIRESLINLGLQSTQIETAHPLIGTLSLVNMLESLGRKSTLSYLAGLTLIEADPTEARESSADFITMAEASGFTKREIEPVLRHYEFDANAGHRGLLERALANYQYVESEHANIVANDLHDLKHSFDQYHDQIVGYYSDISNYVPRLSIQFTAL